MIPEIAYNNVDDDISLSKAITTKKTLSQKICKAAPALHVKSSFTHFFHL